MSIEAARQARDEFLRVLRAGDAEALQRVVDERFTFSDLQGRMQVSAEVLVSLVRERRLIFDHIELISEEAHPQKDGSVRFWGLYELRGGVDSMRYNGRFRIIEVFGPSASGWTARLAAGSTAA